MANVTYTFKPKLTTQSVFWHDPQIWVGGVVPNGPDADVVIPTGTPLPTGGARSDIAISPGEAFTAASLDMFQERLMLDGQLTVEGTARLRENATIAGSGQFGWATGTLNAGAFVNEGTILLANGTLNVGSLVNAGSGIQASGVISVSGQLTNDSSIGARNVNGTSLTVTASSLLNNGALTATSADLSVTVAAGGFANLTGSTLTSGLYRAYDGTLKLNVGGLIETIATNVSVRGGDILSYDQASGLYVSLQSSLHSIAASGYLDLSHQGFEWGTLSVDGVLRLSDHATLLADHITVGTGGRITATGIIEAPIENSGIIEASTGERLVIAGPVTGSGKVVIGPGEYADPWLAPGVIRSTAFLELSGPVSQAVVFSSGIGTLFIDDPASFTGTIAPVLAGRNVITLYGHALADVQSYSYSGDSTGGVLVLHETSGTTSLNIVGEFNATSFTLSAGPQAPAALPSLNIAVGGIMKLLNDTGGSSTDNITSNPTITGKLAPYIQIEIDGSVVVMPDGTNYLHQDANGAWSYTPVGLSDGTHTVVARGYTLGHHAGLYGAGTTSLTFILDTHLTTHDDAYVVLPGQTLSVPVVDGVLANDMPAAPATVTLSSGPAHGVVELGPDSSFTYTPFQGFAGIDVFTYHAAATDGSRGDEQALIYVVPVNFGSTTTLNLVGLSTEEQIGATYLSFFGRAADADGFAFWVDQFAEAASFQPPSMLFANIASSFGVSDEAKALYPFLANPAGASDAEIGAFLDSVYGNLFNRSADAAGLAFWIDQVHQTLAAGQFVGSVLVNILSGAQGTDITTLMGKVAVGLEHVHEQKAHDMAWAGASDIAATAALLHAVTSDPHTVLTGLKNADDLVSGHA
ncbi:Ig-like domain-containing protein [Reyranella sp.]|uniref:Ig-like domain-containing protein n=1 Tax=Reyranella sp. TaxID=1929291 RepID=UPI003784FF5B